jgi:hypothetical protein
MNRRPSTVGVDSQISPSPFDTYDLTQPTSFQLPPTLSPRYQPSTSATIPTRTEARNYLEAHTSSGKTLKISKKPVWKKLQAGTARQAAKRAQKEAYYGVDIHHLLDRINEEKGSTDNQYLRSPLFLIVVGTTLSLLIPPKIYGQTNTGQQNS